METIPKPRISRAPRVPLIWLVPLLAAAIALWMVVRQWSNHGPEIAIEFLDGSGVEVGRTRLDHKGVTVGMVTGVELKEDLNGVIVHVRLERSAAQLARTGAQFWIVHPELGFSGISGLETLVSGAHLSVRPGEGPRATQFRGLDKPPAPENIKDGRAFVLTTDRLGTLRPHAPVLFRDVTVGEVETSRLTEDGSGVLVRIRVRTPYVELVRANSQFWNAGGITVRFSLFGSTEVKTRSLESLVAGAVAFATPNDPGAVAAEGAQFRLNAESEKDWLKWAPKIPIKPVETSPDDRVVPGGDSSAAAEH